MPFSLLLTALAEIRDPRRPQGRRYALAPLLLFSVLAVLAGATSYQGIITFIDVHRERLNTEFGVCFRRAPALNTLRNLFLALDPADLEAAFRRHACHLDKRIGAEGWRTVALDGKTLRGSFDHLHDQPAAHVLSAFARDFPHHYLGDTFEALLVVGRRGYRVGEIPVVMQPRQGGQPSAGRAASVRAMLRAVTVPFTGCSFDLPERSDT